MVNRKPASIAAMLPVIIARASLAALSGLFICSVAPVLVGGRSEVVISGSMAPALQVGDIAISMPARSVRPGQILAVDNLARPGRTLTHRLVAVSPSGDLITKGDQNATPDSTPVPPARVHGVVVLRVPRIGLPFVWARQGKVLPELALMTGLLLLIAGARIPEPKHGAAGGVTPGPARPQAQPLARENMTRITRRRSRPPRPQSGRRGQMMRWAGLTALLLAASTWGFTSSAFTGQTLNEANVFGSTATFPTYPQAVLADGPVAYYRQDDANGSFNAADSSGNGTTGAYVTPASNFQVAGSPAGGAGPSADAAVHFAGSGGQTASSDASLTDPDPFTIEVWFKSVSTSPSRFFGFGERTSGNSFLTDRYVTLQADGRLSFFAGSTTINSPASGYNDGAWHLMDASLGASGMRLYVDGTLSNSNASITTAQNYTGYWRVGGDNRYFAGDLDEAAVYLSELPGGAVAAHYIAGTSAASLAAYTAAVTADNPWALWHLGEDPQPPNSSFPAISMTDSSGQSHPGTYHFMGPAGMIGGGGGALTGVDASSTSMSYTGAGSGYDPIASANPSTFTIECWFRTATTTGGKLIGFGSSPAGISTQFDRHIYMRDDGRLTFGVFPSNTFGIITSSTAYNDGGWHHTAASLGPAGMMLYVDGALVGSNPAVTAAQIFTGYWRWGGDAVSTWPNQPTSQYFSGRLDEVAIYATQLTAQDVAWHYHANH